MSALALVLVAGLLPSVLSLPAAHNGTRSLVPRQTGFNYGSQPVRGVNLGGWLVLEPWITPSLFEATGNDNIIDEYTFGQLQDRGRAQQLLNQHWNTWITESDFAQIAAAGLNHVRIPIGYWAYDISGGEPYIQGQAPFLDKAIGWAKNHGIKVMIDLHGAPGSQNGFDNSGRRGDANWPWNGQNVARTRNVVNALAKKYSQPQYAGVVTSLGLLNEPAGFYGGEFLQTTKQYWQDAYQAARFPNGGNQANNLLLVIHDAFQDISTWDGFMAWPQYENVAMDTHHYQVFSPSQVQQNWDEHLAQVCDLASDYDSSTLWLIVGEWSLATTDCAKWLNGRGRGARYEGQWDGSPYVGNCGDKSGNGNNFSPSYKQFLRKFFDVQTQMYENHANGWIYWCWKNEQAADFSYQTGLAKGWIPRNPGEHQYNLNDVCNQVGAGNYAAKQRTALPSSGSIAPASSTDANSSQGPSTQVNNTQAASTPATNTQTDNTQTDATGSQADNAQATNTQTEDAQATDAQWDEGQGDDGQGDDGWDN